MVADVDTLSASGVFFFLLSNCNVNAIYFCISDLQLKLLCFPLTFSVQFALCSDWAVWQVDMYVSGEHK